MLDALYCGVGAATWQVKGTTLEKKGWAKNWPMQARDLRHLLVITSELHFTVQFKSFAHSRRYFSVSLLFFLALHHKTATETMIEIAISILTVT